MGKQQQYIVGKAASHVGKTVAVCMWKSSCACGKTAAVYMWEKQLYMWENRTCTESTYILYVHKEWCAGISSLIHLWESSSCQSGKIQLCMWGNSSSVLGKSSCKWYKKTAVLLKIKQHYCTRGTVAAVNIGQEQLHMWGKNSCTCPCFWSIAFYEPHLCHFFSDKRQSKLNVRFESSSVDVQ